MLPVTLFLLWLQLYWSLIPTWRDGEYYGYGWFVPPLALAFAWRRWQMWREKQKREGPLADEGRLGFSWSILVLLVVVLIIPLRLIAEGDPNWRPPILLHAFLVVGLSHAVLWRAGSRGFSAFFLPVTLFALTAVPPPWQLEQLMVRNLTGAVIFLTKEVFLLSGNPVEAIGERLVLGSEMVEVTDGCSGVRSLQSLMMAALFFGELLMLSGIRRLILVFAAVACAVVFNTARAWWLADIRFFEGQAAADGAHDWVGHVAFLVSAGSLYLMAWFLQIRRKRGQRIIKRTRSIEPSIQ